MEEHCRKDHMRSTEVNWQRKVSADGTKSQPCGYAACFGGALDYVGKLQKKDATKGSVTCSVSIGPRELGGFGLSVKLRIEDKTLPQAELAALVKEAHEKVCPYSHATRNNVDVQLEVVGA